MVVLASTCQQNVLSSSHSHNVLSQARKLYTRSLLIWHAAFCLRTFTLHIIDLILHRRGTAGPAKLTFIKTIIKTISGSAESLDVSQKSHHGPHTASSHQYQFERQNKLIARGTSSTYD